MSNGRTANGSLQQSQTLPLAETTSQSVSSGTNTNGPQIDRAKLPPRPKKPNYTQIHSRPLPLTIHPLPTFHPTNPLSLLQLVYTYLSQIASGATSSPLPNKYIGYFHPETRSVHVTDPKQIRALWEMGFFGKGTLSRSEPTWLERERTRRKPAAPGERTAEEVTLARREERRLMKLERARVEREKIETQRLVEEGKLPPTALLPVGDAAQGVEVLVPANEMATAEHASKGISSNGDDKTTRPPKVESLDHSSTVRPSVESLPMNGVTEPALQILEQEHLQLTLEEAFFLSYALGVLDVVFPSSLVTTDTLAVASTQKSRSKPNAEILKTFCNILPFPSRPLTTALAPDDTFLLNYVTYHHFRSLGWVVRGGTKFGVDFMLYNRGPVFSHAEFAVNVLPAYTHPSWRQQQQKPKKATMDWWQFHCVNRVQSQVFKTFVLCYVDVPPPEAMPDFCEAGRPDLGALLRAYTVREFVFRRWSANRMR